MSEEDIITPFASDLLALLDLIEQEKDYSLASQRFEIAEMHCMTVEFTSQIASGVKN